MKHRIPWMVALALAAAGCSKEAEAPPEPPKPEAPASRPASRPTAQVLGLPSPSGIAPTKPGCPAQIPCPCAGAVTHGHNALGQIGVTEAKLAEGVYCVFGDFDDNGYADVAVLEGGWTPKAKRAAEVRVLMYDESGLRATAALPKRMQSLGRAKRGGRHVLVEPAAAARYHFAYDDGAFSMAEAR